MCAHAFRQLLGIGAGRFRRLRRCALTDEPLPVDGRCRPRGHDSSNPDASRRRGLVVDFLEEIYQSMSEPMPEADKQFGPDQDHPDYVMPKMRFRRNRGKNPGKRSRDKALQREKLQGQTCPLATAWNFDRVPRHAPGKVSSREVLSEASVLSPLPGFYEAIFFLARGYRLITISELDNNNNIWSATEVMDGPQRSSHFFLFNSCEVWGSSFTKMAIRRVSQHSTCSTCTRHKMILKRLSSDKRARAMQMLEYQKHLVHQYQDRVKYWQARARSRLGMQPSGVSTITLVVDGMDKSKYRYPRSAVCSSKEFAGLVRPALDVSAIICHGYNVVVACSEPYVPKSSSWTTELIAHALSKVASQTDVRSCQIHIQMDNCGRENKNNTVCRFAGMMTGSGRCHSCLLSFLGKRAFTRGHRSVFFQPYQI